ncbi:unnamed protein product [Sympodiomycopsis kandeliae]
MHSSSSPSLPSGPTPSSSSLNSPTSYSPPPPPSKRRKPNRDASRITLDTSLSDELFIRVFSYLNARDLTRLQSVSSRISNLAHDPQIWKKLFIRTFISPEDSGRNRRRNLPTLSDLKSMLLAQQHQHIKSTSHEKLRKIRGLPQRYLSRQVQTATDSIACLDKGKGKAIDFDNTLIDSDIRNDGLDWQALYRVSSNWQKGNYAVSELLDGISSAPTLDTFKSPILQPQQTPKGKKQTTITHALPESKGPRRREILVQSSSTFIFTTSQCTLTDRIAVVNVYVEASSHQDTHSNSRQLVKTLPHDPTANRPVAICKSARLLERVAGLDESIAITDLKVDASHATPTTRSTQVHLMAAYSTGDISIFRLDTSNPSSCNPDELEVNVKEVAFFSSTKKTSASTSPIVMSSFHWPLLVTCTTDFQISIYHLTQSPSDTVEYQLLRQLRSHISHWPATMTLDKINGNDEEAEEKCGSQSEEYTSQSSRRPFSMLKRKRAERYSNQILARDTPNDTSTKQTRKDEQFRLNIAYCTPSYPNNWTVSLQEISMQWSQSNSENKVDDLVMQSRYATARPHISGYSSAEQKRRAPLDEGSSDDDNTIESDRDGFPVQKKHRRWKANMESPRSIFASPPQTSANTTIPTSEDTTLFPSSSNKIISISYNDPYLVVGSQQNTIIAYQINNTSSLHSPLEIRETTILYGHKGSVSSIDLDQNKCVSGSNDGTIIIWNLAQQQQDEAERSLHVLTLRSPRTESQWSGNGTLGQYLRDQKRNLHVGRPDMIKWVNSSFDRVLSVSCTSSNHEDEAGEDGHSLTEHRERETVQVWSFR